MKLFKLAVASQEEFIELTLLSHNIISILLIINRKPLHGKVYYVILNQEMNLTPGKVSPMPCKESDKSETTTILQVQRMQQQFM